MFSGEFGCLGCLAFIFTLMLFWFLFKYLIVIAFIIFLVIWLNKPNFMNKVKKFYVKKEDFVSKPGEVYKECGYCHRKAERKANFCDNCGKPFESTDAAP